MRFAPSHLAFGLALLAAPASALAADQSTDAIVRSLRPTAATGPVRGIRPISPAGGAQAMNGAAASLPARKPSVSLNVDFASGSDELRPGAMKTLDALGRALTGPELSAYKFRIDGHTDTVGADDMNQTLSERRAQTVAHYLADKFQLPTDRMEVVGSGKKGLAVPTADEVDEPRNRRVEVINLGS